MSTKFKQALQNCRTSYLAEREKFFDTLADFIETNKAHIMHGNTIMFFMSIKAILSGSNPTKCEFSFSTYPTNWDKTFTLNFTENDVVNILKVEYNAEISSAPRLPHPAEDTVYNIVAIPFIDLPEKEEYEEE